MAQHRAARAEGVLLPLCDLSSNPAAVVQPSLVLEIYRTREGYIVLQNSYTMVFKVKSMSFNVHQGFLLTDVDNNPIYTLRNKIATAHARWKVFKGDSIDPEHLFFSSARSSIIQRGTELNVFFANKEAEVYDFKLKETASGNSFAIYSGDSSTIVAKVEKLKSDESGHLKVTINPDSDRAFVTAIIVILDQLKRISFDLPCWPLMAAGHVVAGVLESDEL